jgi:hypothetical protein
MNSIEPRTLDQIAHNPFSLLLISILCIYYNIYPTGVYLFTKSIHDNNTFKINWIHRVKWWTHVLIIKTTAFKLHKFWYDEIFTADRLLRYFSLLHIKNGKFSYGNQSYWTENGVPVKWWSGIITRLIKGCLALWLLVLWHDGWKPKWWTRSRRPLPSNGSITTFPLQ